MARIINARIDVSKIDKEKIFVGKKGKYLDLTISIKDEANEYGQDVSIAVNRSKEEREAGEQVCYLGNGKTVWNDGEKASPSYEKPQYDNNASSEDSEPLITQDDIPF